MMAFPSASRIDLADISERVEEAEKSRLLRQCQLSIPRYAFIIEKADDAYGVADGHGAGGLEARRA